MKLTRYRYQAVDENGRKLSGYLEACHVDDLEARLKKKGLICIRATALTRLKRLIFELRYPSSKQQSELMHFFFQLEQLLRAGVPIFEAIEDLTIAAGSKNRVWHDTLCAIGECILAGGTLSQAFAERPDIFDSVLISLIAAGETSGRLPEILLQIVENLRWEDEINNEMRRLLLYPIFTGVFIGATAIFLFTKLIPELKVLFFMMGNDLPLYSLILFRLSDLVVGYWHWLIFVLPCCILALICFFRFNRSSNLLLDRWRLQIPIIGKIQKKTIFARISGAMALLYSSGIPVVEALSMIRNISGNRIAHRAIGEVQMKITEGSPLAQAFIEVNFFPSLLLRMLRVGEQTGRLDETLFQASYFYRREVRESTAQALSLLEPMLTIILGLFLGWIVLAILGPLYDLIGNITL